jgi:hypothetical protein
MVADLITAAVTGQGASLPVIDGAFALGYGNRADIMRRCSCSSSEIGASRSLQEIT